MSEPGLGLKFQVTIDGFIDLGTWTKIEGLGLKYDVKTFSEGGQNGFIHKIPGRAEYSNIRLTRPIDGQSTMVMLWLASVQAANLKGTANIAVLDAAGSEVASWDLLGVWPVSWTGPSLDVFGNQLATETLEISHEGFAVIAALAAAAAAAGAVAGAIGGSASVSF